eukprot:130207-Pleurochrysis_carterae.AAC.1
MIDGLKQSNKAAHKRLSVYNPDQISTAFLPEHASTYGNVTSKMVELQNLLLLPTRRMGSLFSSLILTVISVRQRFLTIRAAAQDHSLR